jgi:hypothetical protein
MNKVKATGVALAIGAAAMFSLAPAYASSSDASNGQVKCVGGNACKGQGSCKTATNSCKGENACKGKGASMMSKEDCAKAGGTVDTAADAAAPAAPQ